VALGDLQEEPSAGKPHARICEGESRMAELLDHPLRRTRFSQFVGSREFEELADGSLSAEFEAYRKSEARLVLSILASGAAVALLGLAVRHAA